MANFWNNENFIWSVNLNSMFFLCNYLNIASMEERFENQSENGFKLLCWYFIWLHVGPYLNVHMTYEMLVGKIISQSLHYPHLHMTSLCNIAWLHEQKNENIGSALVVMYYYHYCLISIVTFLFCKWYCSSQCTGKMLYSYVNHKCHYKI